MPNDISPSDSEGTKWVLLQAWVRTACENAGISGDSSDPILRDISPSDSEGVKWAKLQRWVKTLAENISGSGGDVFEGTVRNYPANQISVSGVVTIDATSDAYKYTTNYNVQVSEDITDIVLTGIPDTTGLNKFRASLTFVQDSTGGHNVTFPTTWEFAGGVAPIIDKRPDAKTVVDVIITDFWPMKLFASVRYPQHRQGTVEVTSTRDVAATDADKYLFSTSATAVTLTVKKDTAPVGVEIDIFQAGAGQVTLSAGTDVTIISKGSNLKLSAQGSAATLKQVTANVWHLVGDLTA